MKILVFILLYFTVLFSNDEYQTKILLHDKSIVDIYFLVTDNPTNKPKSYIDVALSNYMTSKNSENITFDKFFNSLSTYSNEIKKFIDTNVKIKVRVMKIIPDKKSDESLTLKTRSITGILKSGESVKVVVSGKFESLNTTQMIILYEYISNSELKDFKNLHNNLSQVLNDKNYNVISSEVLNCACNN